VALDVGGQRRRRALAEINVTPLVDVMLVLLVVFMVTAPMLQTGVDVNLPDAKAQTIPDDAGKLIVTVTRPTSASSWARCRSRSTRSRRPPEEPTRS
jgi:biopolymer transport protein TolR